MAILTKKWRRAMSAYQHTHGLAPEKGFTVNTNKPLGKPARRLLKRIQNNLVARKLLGEKYANGYLNKPTRKILIPPVAALSVGDRAVRYALSQTGVHESPWGSNSGFDVRRYQSSTGAYHAPWCASFCWYCWQRVGYKGSVSAGAWNSTDTIGTPVAKYTEAKPGDLVSFNIGDGHVGLFLSHSDTMVKTVDGNTNNEVAVRERPIEVIHAITRPHI